MLYSFLRRSRYRMKIFFCNLFDENARLNKLSSRYSRIVEGILFCLINAWILYLLYWDYWGQFVGGTRCGLYREVVSWGTHMIPIVLLVLCALKSRFVAYVIIPFYFTVCLIVWYVHRYISFYPTDWMLYAVLQTNYDEAASFIPKRRLCKILCYIGLMFFMLWGYRKCFSSGIRGFRYLLISLLLCVFGMPLAYHVGLAWMPEIVCKMSYVPAIPKDDNYDKVVLHEMRKVWRPNSYMPGAYYPFHRISDMISSPSVQELLFPPKLTDASEMIETAAPEDELLIILYIGESFRADHSPWNGYKRNTLPKLSDMKRDKCGVFVNFPYFKSFNVGTYVSIYGILSDATCQKRKATYTSFIGPLRKSGYRTTLMVSRCPMWDEVPMVNHLIENHLDEVIHIRYPENNDEVTEKLAESLMQHEGKPRFIVINDELGHHPYGHDENFDTFPVHNSMDSYDNALIQVDDLLSKVIKLFENRKTVFLYVSDHGESFGEKGFYIHGGPLNTPEQRHIFSFAWFSKEFAATHPKIVSTIRENSKKLLSHDFIYHTMLSLAHIRVKFYEPSIDMTVPISTPDATSFEADSRLDEEVNQQPM